MIDIRFKGCCETCSHIDVDYDTVHSFGGPITVITCRHACVCGEYESEEGLEGTAIKEISHAVS